MSITMDKNWREKLRPLQAEAAASGWQPSNLLVQKNKPVALVTGASQGIGLQIARILWSGASSS